MRKTALLEMVDDAINHVRSHNPSSDSDIPFILKNLEFLKFSINSGDIKSAAQLLAVCAYVQRAFSKEGDPSCDA